MKPTLLIVDDEKNIREGFRDALDDRYDVYLAEDARHATELLEKDQFDVLLTDFRLPGEDGMKLVWIMALAALSARSLTAPDSCLRERA